MMMKALQFLILMFLNGVLLPAQPLEPIGCHHAHASAFHRAPTIEELILMENSNRRSDSFNILHYKISLDVTDYAGKTIQGNTEIRFVSLLGDLKWIIFDLQTLQVDSVIFQGKTLTYTHQNNLLQVYFGSKLPQGTIGEVRVYYQGKPHRDPVWGGFYFEENYIYNLGIGLSTTPPNFGKVWFPCFDNFVERSTFEYIITSTSDKKAYCVGTFISEDTTKAGVITRHYFMHDQIPTYLSSIAVSNYTVDNSMHVGIDNDIPIELIAKPTDISKMKSNFINLPKAIDAFEYWFGKYRFERVGYVATTVGAMEHPTNVAYPISVILSGTQISNEKLYGHEFGHHWWGDLTTLSDAKDMWIKEGNAEYSAHLFIEYLYGKQAFLKTVKGNMAEILKQAHNSDGDYLALSPMPYEHTYGTHTYKKGAAMIHNMRAVLGDSLYRRINHIIFDSLSGKSMDAYEYLDFMNKYSGKNMSSYFDDYIFNKGYCTVFMDSLQVNSIGSGHSKINFSLYQKSYHATHLYSNVEVPVRFYNPLFGYKDTVLLLNGPNQSYQLEFNDFVPSTAIINEKQTYNWATIQSNTTITKNGAPDLSYGDITSLNVSSIKDSFYINISHHLVAPNEGSREKNILGISDRHFWQVAMTGSSFANISGNIEYNGKDSIGFDETVLEHTEDSVILAYRKDFSEPWKEYSFYTKKALNLSDKKGFFLLSNILPGEYTVAYCYKLNVSVESPNQIEYVQAYPNPVEDAFFLRINNPNEITYVKAHNFNGQEIGKLNFENLDRQIKVSLDKQIPSGMYRISLWNQNQECRGISLIDKK